MNDSATEDRRAKRFGVGSLADFIVRLRLRNAKTALIDIAFSVAPRKIRSPYKGAQS